MNQRNGQPAVLTINASPTHGLLTMKQKFISISITHFKTGQIVFFCSFFEDETMLLAIAGAVCNRCDILHHRIVPFVEKGVRDLTIDAGMMVINCTRR